MVYWKLELFLDLGCRGIEQVVRVSRQLLLGVAVVEGLYSRVAVVEAKHNPLRK